MRDPRERDAGTSGVVEAATDRATTVAAYAAVVLAGHEQVRAKWRRYAACAGDERFYEKHQLSHADLAHHRRVCDSCPVIADCLLEALLIEVHDPQWQVETRGGLRPVERAILTAQRPRRRTTERPTA